MRACLRLSVPCLLLAACSNSASTADASSTTAGVEATADAPTAGSTGDSAATLTGADATTGDSAATLTGADATTAASADTADTSDTATDATNTGSDATTAGETTSVGTVGETDTADTATADTAVSVSETDTTADTTTADACVDGDGACGPGCTAADDDDCAPACDPGQMLGPVQISMQARGWTPWIAVIDDERLVVTWVHSLDNLSSKGLWRVVDRATLEPLGEPVLESGGALSNTGDLRAIDTPEGFALSYSFSDYTTGKSRCPAVFFDENLDELGGTFDTADNFGCASPRQVVTATGVSFGFMGDSALVQRRIVDNGTKKNMLVVDADAWVSHAMARNPLTGDLVFAYSAVVDNAEELVVTRTSELGDIKALKLRVSHGKGNSRDPEIVWTGAGFGVVWNEKFQTFFAPLAADGTPGADVLAVEDGAFARLAWADGVYGVVTRGNTGDLRLHLLDPAGAPIGGPTVIAEDLVATTINASVLWDPLHGRFVAAWSGIVEGPNSEEVFIATACPSR